MFEGHEEYRVGARSARRGVGDILREAREAGGETIFEAAEATRIRAEYLFALEAEEFHRLPGWAYALSYVRTYAEYLGLDPSPVVKRVREQYELRQHMLVEEAVNASARRPRRRYRALIAAVLVAAGGGWLFTDSAVSVAAMLGPFPKELKALIDRSFFTVADDAAGSGEPATAALGAADIGAVEPAAPSAVAPAPIARGSDARVAALRQAEPGGTLTIATHPRGTIDRDTAIATGLVLRARGPVWLSVEDNAGGLLMAQQLRSGELVRMPAEPGLRVSADDGGAVEYYLDGTLVGMLGQPGQQISRLPVGRLTGARAGG